EPGRALEIVCEQPVHITPGDAAIHTHSTVAAAICESKERPLTIRTARAADMHFISSEGGTVCHADAAHLVELLFAGQHRLDVEQAEPLDAGAWPFNTGRIRDA